MKLGKSLINPDSTFRWLELNRSREGDSVRHRENSDSTSPVEKNAAAQIEQGEEARFLALQFRNTILKNS